MDKQRSGLLKTQASSRSTPDRNMSVAVRIRPLSSKEISSNIPSCCSSIGGGIVCIKRSGDLQANLKSQTADSVNDFAFDNVFTEESTQEDVYNSVVQPVVRRFLAGENGTVFAYGATGAGKSYTMLGQRFADRTMFPTSDEESSRGLIHRALEEVLLDVENRRREGALGEGLSLHLSFCEIYNDQVQDLLAAPSTSTSILPQPKYLQLREDADRGVVEVAGLSERDVRSVGDAIAALQQGTALRRTDATGANAVSSRSHAIIQLQLRHLKRTNDGRERMIESRFTFVDLAGSERASATNNRGMRLQEGANINKSLLALGNCINALSENRHVKYRDSKLTLFLKPSLEGNCNLVMVANINPAQTSYEDSLHTLTYAARAKAIKIRPEVRERLLESTSLEREVRLREENDLLKQRVAQLEQECQRLRQVEAASRERLEELEANHRRKSRMSFGFVGRGSKDRASRGSRSSSSRPSSASPKLPAVLDEDDVIVQLPGEETVESSSNGDADQSSVASAAVEATDAAEPAAMSLEETDVARTQQKTRRGQKGLFSWFICGGDAGQVVGRDE